MCCPCNATLFQKHQLLFHLFTGLLIATYKWWISYQWSERGSSQQSWGQCRHTVQTLFFLLVFHRSLTVEIIERYFKTIINLTNVKENLVCNFRSFLCCFGRSGEESPKGKENDQSQQDLHAVSKKTARLSCACLRRCGKQKNKKNQIPSHKSQPCRQITRYLWRHNPGQGCNFGIQTTPGTWHV